MFAIKQFQQKLKKLYVQIGPSPCGDLEECQSIYSTISYITKMFSEMDGCFQEIK